MPYDDRVIINSEIICYPITNISRPLDMFGAFPKTVKSYVPVVPPPPPSRKSSRTNSTLKIVDSMKSSPTRFKSVPRTDSGTKPVEINRSRSTGASFITYVSTSQREKIFDARKRLTKRILTRESSSSPVGRLLPPDRRGSKSPVAFGRGISKERAFAEEKKKIEEKLGKISKDLHVSTRILRNPELKSPNQVKEALKNTFRPIAYTKNPKLTSTMIAKSLESRGFCQNSTSRNGSKSEQQKSLKVTVAISSRGRGILQTTTETPRRQISNASSMSSKSSSLLKRIPSNGRMKAKLKGPAQFSTSNLTRTNSNSTFSIDSVVKAKASEPKDKRSKSTEKGSERKTLFQDPPMVDNRKVMESFDQALVHQNEAMKSDLFFRKLLKRDILSKYGLQLNPNISVQEKTRMWNALTASKSEPSLKFYKVRERESQSKMETFKIFDGEPLRGGFVTEKICKYDSLYELSDDDERSNRGRSLDISYSYHERSNSEPPNKTVLTEFVEHRSPRIIYGRKPVDTERRQRSPSCRRIQSLKTNKTLELSSYQKELTRALSVGCTDRAKEKLNNRSFNLHRSRSLNILNYEGHLPICGHKKNDRFRDLSEFYTCLERIGQLECATSNSDVRPCRKNQKIIDYELWQKHREYEKNERELNILVKKLLAEQQDKDFLFQPHSTDEVRWSANSDLSLVTKENSVENLKELFLRNSQITHETKRTFQSNLRDVYKPLWRANSVLNLATNMTKKYNEPKASGSGKSESKRKSESKNLGLSKKLLSTLSRDQLNKIKNQLNEIYSNDKASENIEEFVVTVTPKEKSPPPKDSGKPFLTVRSHSELSPEQVHEPSIDITTLKNVFEKKRTSSTASIISESEKRSISHTLCQEIKNKFLTKKVQKPELKPKKKFIPEHSQTLPLPNKPKRDISFKFQEAPPAVSKYLIDCIPDKKIAPKENGSVSSETSNRTVIFREAATSMEDVQTKIKYFEEIEREKEKVPVTIYHACDDPLSPEEEEDVKKSADEATETSSRQIISPPKPARLMTSRSFTDLKDIFGERLSMKSENCRRSRSSGSESEKHCSSLNEFGEVEEMRKKFENSCSADESSSCYFATTSGADLSRNVSYKTYNIEMSSERARSRAKRASPIPKNAITKDDRLMPHINVISKTASLKKSQKKNHDKGKQQSTSSGEVVAAIKHKFEAIESNLSLMGKMYTSVPEINELKSISPLLTHLPYCGSFATHQYPLPEDNNRSVYAPHKSPPGVQPRKRPSSASPTRSKQRSSPSDVTKQLRDIFDCDYDLSLQYGLEKQAAEAGILYKKKLSPHIKAASVSSQGYLLLKNKS